MSLAIFYLIGMMPVSWFLGVVMFASGVILRFKLGEAASLYLEGVNGVVDLKSASNEIGQSICPVLEDIPNQVTVGYWAIFFSALLIINGTILILYSTMGLVGALKSVTEMILLVVVCIPISVTIDFYLYNVMQNLDSDFHSDAKEDMVKLLRDYYAIEGDERFFTELLNAVMIMNKCCGINGAKDFNNLTFVEKLREPTIYLFRVPPACCTRDIFNSHSSYTNLKMCAMEGLTVPSHIQSRGCYDTAFSHLHSPKARIVFHFLVFTIIWSIMELILIVVILLGFGQRQRVSISSTQASGSVRTSHNVPQARDSQGSYYDDIRAVSDNQYLDNLRPHGGETETSTENQDLQSQSSQQQYSSGQQQTPGGQSQYQTSAQPRDSRLQSQAPITGNFSNTQKQVSVSQVSEPKIIKKESDAPSGASSKISLMEKAHEMAKTYAASKAWPLAKASSYDHPEVGRIRSTTVW